MAIKHRLYTSCLAGVAFVGPHSEALLGDWPDPINAAYSYYHCDLGFHQKKITVSQAYGSADHSSCRVSWQHNKEESMVLWDSQRNLHTCEASANAIALRLEDRGWQCEYAALPLASADH